MKINYTNYPFLKGFEKKNIKRPLFVKGDETILLPQQIWKDIKDKDKALNKLFVLMKSSLNGNVNYVSSSVLKVFDEDFAVADRLWKLRDEIHGTTGVLLCPKGEMYFYRICTGDAKDSQVEVACFHFIEKRLFDGFTLTYWDKGSFYHENSVSDASFAYSSFEQEYKEKGFNLTWFTQLVVTFELFKKYAEIETKTISKGRVSKAKVNTENYKSTSIVPVTIVDSHWFTNIIRSDGFNVKGHFRLQPCGKERKDRKLIWINEFEKSGYVRNARILSS